MFIRLEFGEHRHRRSRLLINSFTYSCPEITSIPNETRKADARIDTKSSYPIEARGAVNASALTYTPSNKECLNW
jgi:hypothetical protein